MKKMIPCIILQFLFISMVYPDPIKVIVDSDMDSDIDDLTALALLHYFADRDEVEILGTISCSSVSSSVELIDAINTFYNRPNIPVAVPKKGAPKHSWVLKGDSLSREFPHDANVKNSPSATELYRRLLAAQPDSSVVIISLGYLTNLNDLLLSKADKYSPLTGTELVVQKVKIYYCMGSRYPKDDAPVPAAWGNFRPDPASTDYVVQNWPTKICFTGGGGFSHSIKTGNGLKELPVSNPVRRAYELAKGDESKDWTHHSADVIAVWLAVRGTGPFFQETAYGYNEIDQYGRNSWEIDKDNPKQSYVSDFKPGINPGEVGYFFDSLFTQFTNITKQD